MALGRRGARVENTPWGVSSRKGFTISEKPSERWKW